MSQSLTSNDLPQAPLTRNIDLLPSMEDMRSGEEAVRAARKDGSAAADGAAKPGRAPVGAASVPAIAVSEPPLSVLGMALAVARPTLFLVALLAILISLSPFADRSGKAMLSTFEIGSRLNQVFFPLLLLSILAVLGTSSLRFLRLFARPAMIAFFVWLALSTLTSLEPMLSARRATFFTIQMAIALLAMALPRSPRQLAVLYALAASCVLVLSYGGVLLAPELSIHQLTDAVETDLAGNWRGVFRHKNEAGAVMVVMVFVGLYVARALNYAIGIGIAAGAAVFLSFTMSKSSMILLPVSLLLAWGFERCRTLRWRAATVLSLLVLFNVATLGSSFPGPIRAGLQRVMPDVTFTGRTDLWRFAMEHVALRPLTGYGIGAFWRTSATMHRDREEAGPEDTSGWVAELGTDSHNGYLDVAVSMGLPGALLLIVMFVLLPIRDAHAALAEPRNRDLARFYVRCWIYVLYLSSVESLLMPLNPIWYLMIQSVFGLILLTHYRLRQRA